MADADDLVLSQEPQQQPSEQGTEQQIPAPGGQQQPPAQAEIGLPAASTVTINFNTTPVASRDTSEAAGDIAGILQIIAWPLVLLALALVFRRQLRRVFTHIASNVKSVSIAGVSVELAERTAPPIVEAGGAAVDIRQAGTENNVDDSTLRSFYEQIEAISRLDLAIVDLGSGYDWLTSRLYILSVILRRMRGLQGVIFVGGAEDLRGRFIGICSIEVVRWRLAREFPRYEEALASGNLRAVQPQGLPQALIENDEGRLNREAAAELLRGFLEAVQRDVAPPPGEQADWQELKVQPGEAPVWERANWIDAALVERILGGALDVDAIPVSQFQFADAKTRTRIVLEHAGPWVPLVGIDGRFRGWIDRSVAVESLARHGLDLQQEVDAA
jgi:hypothetical protein